MALDFGTSLSQSALDSIARLQFRAEVEARQSRIAKTPETQTKPDPEPVAPQSPPLIDSVSLPDTIKKQRTKIGPPERRSSKLTSDLITKMPLPTIREFYEGLRENVELDEKTTSGHIDKLKTETGNLLSSATSLIEERADAFKEIKKKLSDEIRQAKAVVIRIRRRLAKAHAAYIKAQENAEYIQSDNEAELLRHKKNKDRFKNEIDQTFAKAKQEIEEHKFAASKIIDGTRRKLAKYNQSDTGEVSSTEKSQILRDACSELFELITRQPAHLESIHAKLDELEEWKSSLPGDPNKTSS